jgi:hypothetical protein
MARLGGDKYAGATCSTVNFLRSEGAESFSDPLQGMARLEGMNMRARIAPVRFLLRMQGRISRFERSDGRLYPLPSLSSPPPLPAARNLAESGP